MSAQYSTLHQISSVETYMYSIPHTTVANGHLKLSERSEASLVPMQATPSFLPHVHAQGVK